MPPVATASPTTSRADTWARRILGATVLGVSAYVASWLVSGLLIDGYDPTTQAISETFAIGAPTITRVLMSVALVATGMLLVAFGPAVDRLAPGTGRAVVWTSAVAGGATMLIAAAPCTAGCPGFGTTPIDSAHTLLAGLGYIALIATPLVVAWRVRTHDPVLARLSWAFGLTAAVVFTLGLTATFDSGGLVQRTYNTIADAWYVVAGLWILRTTGTHDPAGSRVARDVQPSTRNG